MHKEFNDTIRTDQKAELDKRLDSYYENPEAGSPWHEVKKRILEEHYGKKNKRFNRE